MKPITCAITFVFAVAVAVAAPSALAQTIKPGLWQMSSNVQSASGEMGKAMAAAQREMASMPPEQRKMMEEMMAKQGVKMELGGAGGMAVKVCLTKEMIERNQITTETGNCQTSHAPRVGNTQKLSFTCTNPTSKGEGQITFVSANAYQSKMTVTTSSQGRTETINMDSSASWLGADCGTIKPLAPPR